jgi:hypothetical protein
MNLNPKIEQLAEAKPSYLMDHESVAKDKCYKLGVWLHGEHRSKFKKAVAPAESSSKQTVSEEDADKRETVAPKDYATVKPSLKAGSAYKAITKPIVHRPYFPIKKPVYTLLANG